MDGTPPSVTTSTAYIRASVCPGTRLAMRKEPVRAAVNENWALAPDGRPWTGSGTEAPGKARVALLGPVTTAHDVRREPRFSNRMVTRQLCGTVTISSPRP